LTVLVDEAGPARTVAVEGLTAVARSRADADPTMTVRDRATDALVEALAEGDGDLVRTVSPELRLVATERPAVAERLDDPVAAVLGDFDHPAHQRVAADIGLLLAERGEEAPLPAVQAALRGCLGGPDDVRANVATAYVLVGGRPKVVREPGFVAERLAILDRSLDRRFPPAGRLRRFAEGRTVGETVVALRDVERDRG
jgi:hypothetical protein